MLPGQVLGEMKCFNHPVEAVGVCANCGRGVCVACVDSGAQFLTCSKNCAATLAQRELRLHSIMQKGVQSLWASAFYSYLSAALLAGAAVIAYYNLPSPLLIYFAAGGALVALLSGLWSTVAAKRQKAE